MNRKSALCFAVSVFSVCSLAASPPDANRRLRAATESFRESMAAPDKGIPRDLFDQSQCIIIIPGLLKGAFVWGGKYGRGYAACRLSDKSWSGPAAVGIEGGSFGLQLGGSSTDVIMLVMNQTGMRSLLSDKFTLGGEAAAAAGPVGRNTSANTDVMASAGILSWSRSRGLFAGLSLEGATLHADNKENLKVYGKPANNRDILTGEVPVPPSANSFTCALDAFTPGAPSPCGASAAGEPSPGGEIIGQVLFASGSSTITSVSESALLGAAKALRDHPDWKARVEGYADSTGNPDSNQELSERRAESVLDWLVKHDISPDRLSAHGYGSGSTEGEDTSESRAQSRRVSIVRVP